MTLFDRNKRAVAALIVLCGFAFWQRGNFFWNQKEADRTQSVRSVGSSPRFRSAPPPDVPVLPEFTLQADQVHVTLTREEAGVPVVSTPASPVCVSEIFYHPREQDGDAEFVELMNPGPEPVSLAGWRFTQGIQYTFPAGPVLASGGCVVLCRDASAFRRLFGEVPGTLFVFAGSLKNSGKTLWLETGAGEVVLEQSYGDSDPWPKAADGQGESLQRVNRELNPNDPASWRAAAPTPGVSWSGEKSGTLLAILEAGHEPASPSPDESVTITGRVFAAGARFRVELDLEVGGVHHRFPVDSAAGIEGASVHRVVAVLPPLPHFTLVRYQFRAVDSAGGEHRFPPEGVSPESMSCFVRNREPGNLLPVYSLILAPADLAALHANAWNNETVGATLIAGGRVFDPIRIRTRGAFARSWPKKSYKLIFEPGNRLEGRGRMNLNSSWRDPGFIRELFSYAIPVCAACSGND